MKQKLIEILKTMVDPEKINSFDDDIDLVNDLQFDSLQTINFILAIEEEFGIEINFENFDFEMMESINKMSSFLEEQM